MKDICNPFYKSDDSFYYFKFGAEPKSEKTEYCSPGCIDNYYDQLQFFNGETSRPRERLFFSNYTHLANKLYPSPLNLRTIYRPMMGFRTIAGDARKQATNFTDCPDFWNVFKVEAAVYPIDDEFNMCSDNAFYKQSIDESIDCANTEEIGYFFITFGAVLIVTMYIVWFFRVFIKRIDFQWNDTKFEDEFKIFKEKYEKSETKGRCGRCMHYTKSSLKNSVRVIKRILTPLPLPTLRGL